MWSRTGFSSEAKNIPTYYRAMGEGVQYTARNEFKKSTEQRERKGREQTVAAQLIARILAETAMVVHIANHSCRAHGKDDCVQILKS